MKTITINLVAFLLFVCLSSCGTDTVDNTTDRTTTEERIEEEKTNVVPQTNDAKLQEWKNLIDNNVGASLDEENYAYTCDGWGGSLSFVSDNEKLRAIVHVNGGEDGSEIKKFYYNDNNELVLIWREFVLWTGDNNTTTQTTYYIENGQPFKVLVKEAKGTSATIEEALKNAKEVLGTVDGFGDLEADAGNLSGLTSDQVQAYFCN